MAIISPIFGQTLIEAELEKLSDSELVKLPASHELTYAAFSVDDEALLRAMKNRDEVHLEIPGWPSFSFSLQEAPYRSDHWVTYYHGKEALTHKSNLLVFTEKRTPSADGFTIFTWTKTGFLASFVRNGKHYRIYPITPSIADKRPLYLITIQGPSKSLALSCGVGTANNAYQKDLLVSNCSTRIATDEACDSYSPGTEACSPGIETDMNAYPELYIELAIEADNEFFQKWGGNSTTYPDIQDRIDLVDAEITTLVTEAEEVYIKYFKTYLPITSVKIWDEQTPDPFSGTTDAVSLWGEFQQYWIDNFPECGQHDVGLLLSGKQLDAEGYVGPAGVEAICQEGSNRFLPFQKSSYFAVNVTRHHQSNFSNSAAIAHEILHSIGLDAHEDEGSPACTSICGGGDYFFCSVGQGESAGPNSKLTAKNQCRAYAILLSNACCLGLNNYSGDCTACNDKITWTIKADNNRPFLGCEVDNADLISYTVEVCNDCTPRDLVINYLHFRNGQQFLSTDMPNTGAVAQENYDRYSSPNLSFAALECKQFTFEAQVTASVGSFDQSVFLYSPEFNNTSSTARVTINTSPPTAVGNQSLSSLIGTPDFPDQANPAFDCTLSPQRNVSITGELVVDVPYCLKNYRFSMGTNAKIKVASGVGLDAQDSDFLACSNMWDAIELEAGASLTVDNCTFRQAHNAIRGKGNNRIMVSNSQFLDNRYGIFYSGTSMQDGDILVRACEFRKDEGLNAGSTDTPAAGMWVQNALLTQVLDGTRFEHMYSGIIARQTQLDVQGATFEQIVPNNGPLLVTGAEGVAINFDNYLRSSGGGVEVGGSTLFKDCVRGVKVDQAYAIIEDSDFEQVDYAIRLAKCNFRRIEVADNTIEAFYGGIELQQNHPAIVQVINNNITIDNSPATNYSQASFGILNATPTARTSRYTIDVTANNIITMKTGRNGIELLGGRRRQVINNYVYLPQAGIQTQRGIQLTGLNLPKVGYNQVFGPTAAANDGRQGILIEGNMRPEIYCNTTTGLEKGMRFTGLNDRTVLSGNTFAGGKVGLELAANASIDDQIHNGNRWKSGGFTGDGAVHLSNSSQQWDLSTFVVDISANGGNGYSYRPSDITPEDGWFTNVIAPNGTYGCAATPSPPSPEPYGKTTTIEEEVINGTFILPQFPTTAPQVATARLLTRLTEDGVAGSWTDNSFTQFLQSHTNSIAGNVQNHKLTIGATHQQGIPQLDSIVIAWEGAAQTREDLRSSYTITERDNYLPQLIQYNQSLAQKLSSVVTLEDQALAQLSALSTSNLPEYAQAEATIQPILSQAVLDTLDGVDSLALYQLAISCPWVKGDAVYEARALFKQLDPSIDFSEVDYCATNPALQQLPEENTPKHSQVFTDLLYPNPVNESLSLMTQYPIAMPSQLSVWDIQGKNVTTTVKVDGGERTWQLDTSQLPKGIYFLHIQYPDEETAVLKFTKQ